MSTQQEMDAIFNDARFQDMMFNAMTSRSEILSKFMDPRRDIDDECGYLKTEQLDIGTYKTYYDREPVAARVVEVFPHETWRVLPSVFETDISQVTTPFEKAFEEVCDTLRGNSYYKDPEENPLWTLLKRLDVMSGIGSYGCMLIGLDDDADLHEEVEGYGKLSAGGKPTHQILYCRVFSENHCEVSAWDDDENSVRFGLPLQYKLTFFDMDSDSNQVVPSTTSAEVHWHRVIHVADNIESNEAFGVSRMRPVINRIQDLRKLHSGSPEMYWRGAFPGISLETHPSLGGDVDVDAASMRTMMENYMNGLQRYLNLVGMTAKTLAPQVVDPSPHIESQIDAICIRIGVPKRIFVGSERGELASSQDERAWNQRCAARQKDHVTPRIIVPTVDRFIQLGVLPAPAQFKVKWPAFESMNEVQTAAVNLQRTEMLIKYIQGRLENIIHPEDFLTKFALMEQDEAEAVIQRTLSDTDDLFGDLRDEEKPAPQGPKAADLPDKVDPAQSRSK